MTHLNEHSLAIASSDTIYLRRQLLATRKQRANPTPNSKYSRHSSHSKYFSPSHQSTLPSSHTPILSPSYLLKLRNNLYRYTVVKAWYFTPHFINRHTYNAIIRVCYNRIDYNFKRIPNFCCSCRSKY
jgi:hypothetical protein